MRGFNELTRILHTKQIKGVRVNEKKNEVVKERELHSRVINNYTYITYIMGDRCQGVHDSRGSSQF